MMAGSRGRPDAFTLASIQSPALGASRVSHTAESPSSYTFLPCTPGLLEGPPEFFPREGGMVVGGVTVGGGVVGVTAGAVTF
jgi:hypothetical protein